jgi:hypothetical protein
MASRISKTKRRKDAKKTLKDIWKLKKEETIL